MNTCAPSFGTASDGVAGYSPYMTVGICGLCGGNVTIPTTWVGTNNPTPTCQRCHATKRPDPPPTLPVLEMVPAK